MAGKRQLPPVKVVSGADSPVPQTVSGAVDRLSELRAMRRVLAAHVDSENTLARDLAALVRQLRDISKEIEELEAGEAEGVGVIADDGSDSSDAPFKLEVV